MNTLLIYLLESTLCVSVLYVIYWLFLKRDTFFSVNRFYMLTMVLFSFLLPLLPFRWTPSDPSASVVIILEPVLITPARVQQTLLEHFQWIEIAGIVYLTGVVLFLFRFGFQLIQLYLITRRFGIREHEGYRLVFVNRSYAPFSFFNLVFLNEEMVPAGSLKAILAHEQVHIRQYHTADMILIELAAIVQWFNPFIWLTGREMKTIHEYLADENVLQNGISRPIYQQMILDETMGIRVNNLTNNFNVSLLKKRIAMMTKSKSKTWAKSKVLIALPVLLVLLFLLTARSYSNSEVLNAAGSPVFAPVHLTSGPDPVIQDKPRNETQIKYVAPVTGKEVFTVAEKMPSYPGGQDAMSKFLVEHIKYPEVAMKNNVQGKVFVTFVVRTDGSLTDAKVLRGIGGGCDEEALRVVKLMPKWNPGEQTGKLVDVQFNLPIKFALDCNKKEEPKK
jgi:TonB family protein